MTDDLNVKVEEFHAAETNLSNAMSSLVELGVLFEQLAELGTVYLSLGSSAFETYSSEGYEVSTYLTELMDMSESLETTKQKLIEIDPNFANEYGELAMSDVELYPEVNLDSSEFILNADYSKEMIKLLENSISDLETEIEGLYQDKLYYFEGNFVLEYGLIPQSALYANECGTAVPPGEHIFQDIWDPVIKIGELEYSNRVCEDIKVNGQYYIEKLDEYFGDGFCEQKGITVDDLIAYALNRNVGLTDSSSPWYYLKESTRGEILDQLEAVYVEGYTERYNEYLNDRDEILATYKAKMDRLAEAELDLVQMRTTKYAMEQYIKELPYIELAQTESYKTFINNLPDDFMVGLDALKDFFPLEYMSIEDKQMISYLMSESGNLDKVWEYKEAIQDRINYLYGQMEADEFIASITGPNGEIDYGLAEGFLTSIEGLGDGAENFGEGLVNLFSPSGIKSVNNYAQMFKLAYLADKGLLPNTYEISLSIGNMLPSMVVSLALSYVNPYLGSVVGSTLMGMSAAGNACNQALIEGYDRATAYTYGMYVGLSETTLGLLLGNIPILNVSAKFSLAGLLKEGLEEGLQTYVEAGLRYSILGEPVDFSSYGPEALKAFIYGMITSGIMTGGSLAVESISTAFHQGGININTYNDLLMFFNILNSTDSSVKIDNKNNKIYLDPNVSATELANVMYLYPNATIVNFNGAILQVGKNADSVIHDIIVAQNINSVSLTPELVNTLFQNADYVTQKQFIDSVRIRLENGEVLSESTYNAIFNSDLFAANSDFAKDYLHDTIVDFGSPELAYLVSETYDAARKATEKNPNMKDLHSYCDHTEAHVLQVAFLSMSSLNATNTSINNGNTANGKYGVVSDFKTIFVSGLAHDLGMAAGVFDTKGNPVNPSINSYLTTDENGNVELKSEVITDREGVANIVRGNHTLNSALFILQNRTMFENMGVDPDLVALLCFSHSKSNSGVVSLTSEADWAFSIEKIADAATTYNNEIGNAIGAPIIFDISKFGQFSGDIVETSPQKIKGKPKQAYGAYEIIFNDNLLSQLATYGLALRVGDAYVNKAKINLPSDQVLTWTYGGKTYSTNMLVLTQTGMYMAYDPTATVYYDNGTQNTADTEASQRGAFIYFKRNSDGTFVPWNPTNSEIVYSVDESGAFVITDENNQCLMSAMGKSTVELEINGKDIKFTILDNGYYLNDGKYYDIIVDTKGKVQSFKEITSDEDIYNEVKNGSPITTTSGQFLVGESNVTYGYAEQNEFVDGKLVSTVVSKYYVSDIEIFPYNTIDKGIIERVGEVSTATGLNREVDVVFNESQLESYFVINADGTIEAKNVSSGEINYGKIYIDHILAASRKNANKGIEFTINGHIIKK